MPDPTKVQGVVPQEGDDPGSGVQGSEGMPQKEGVPLEPGMPQQTPGVPQGAPMAQEPQRVEGQVPKGYVSQADMDRLRSTLQRQNYELQQQAAEARRREQEWQYKAETADMPDDEKHKYRADLLEREIQRINAEREEERQLWAWRQEIADTLGVDPGSLNPYVGVREMLRQAAVQVTRPPLPSSRSAPSQPTRTPTTPPPVAPSAPTSTAPKGEFDELMSLSWAERRKRIPKKGTRAYEEFMERLGEEK